MSRWRRRKQRATADAVAPVSAVRIVGPAERSDATAAESSETASPDISDTSDTSLGVLAELSSAFADGDDDAAMTDAPDDPDATAETSDDDLGSWFDDDESSGERTPITISISGDDDLPDAVYLDEALDDDASGTVFIDDDGSGDAMPAHDAASRGMEPRLRQRRIGVRRAEGRRRLRVVGLVALVLVVVIGVLATLGSSLFAVDDVDVAGVQYTDRAAVDAIVDDLLGEPVLLVDTGAAEDRLEAIPYVEAARVRTDFPGSLRIEIRERRPVATSEGTDGRFRILDADGRVVDVIDGQPVAFVLIDTIGGLMTEAGGFAPDGVAAAASLSVKLTPEIRGRLESMSAAPDGSDLRLTLTNGDDGRIEVRLGAAITDCDQIERLVRLQLLLDEVVSGETTVIDVSTAETTER